MVTSRAIKKRLTVKDLIITGIFSALLLISIVIGTLPLAINPFTTFFSPISAALLGGPIFILLASKVPKRGPISIAGILFGLFLFLTGMHWGMVLGYIICAIIADLLCGMKNYTNSTINSIAYAVFSMGAIGPFLVYFADPAAWTATMLANGTSQGYIAGMEQMADRRILVIMLAGTACSALLSAYLGNKLLRRQFERAGITS